MSNCIQVEGFEELESLLEDMTITEADEKKAMRAAINPIAEEVEKDTPEDTRELKESIKKQVKKEELATVGFVRMGKFYDIFQEFGTSKSKKNAGFFERAVNRSKDEAVKILGDKLLDKVK